MRTSLGDHLLVLRRPAALAALAAATGGVVATMAPTLPLWELVAEVRALDTTGDQAVTTLPGAETTPLVWALAGVGFVVVLTALLLALDRPPARAGTVLAIGGIAILALTGALLLDRPDTTAFVDRPGAAELVHGSVALPTGVEMELTVVATDSTWVLVAAGLVVLAGTAVAHRHG